MYATFCDKVAAWLSLFAIPAGWILMPGSLSVGLVDLWVRLRVRRGI